MVTKYNIIRLKIVGIALPMSLYLPIDYEIKKPNSKGLQEFC